MMTKNDDDNPTTEKPPKRSLYALISGAIAVIVFVLFVAIRVPVVRKFD